MDEKLKSWIRHGLTGIGAVLATYGAAEVLKPETVDLLSAGGAQLIVGIITYGTGQFWSLKRVKKLLKHF